MTKIPFIFIGFRILNSGFSSFTAILSSHVIYVRFHQIIDLVSHTLLDLYNLNQKKALIDILPPLGRLVIDYKILIYPFSLFF